MKFSWGRVCLDDAQMVESGVGKAATVAKMIPRINAWAITGTPVCILNLSYLFIYGNVGIIWMIVQIESTKVLLEFQAF